MSVIAGAGASTLRPIPRRPAKRLTHPNAVNPSLPPFCQAAIPVHVILGLRAQPPSLAGRADSQDHMDPTRTLSAVG